MNTQIVRKIAISKILASLFENTCKYNPEDLARWGKLEPDIKALAEFRIELGILANKHFENVLINDDIQDAIKFVWNVGAQYGHCTSSYTTGTWGVRYSRLQDILKVLAIPNFELINAGEKFTLNGSTFTLLQSNIYPLYDIHEYTDLWIYIQSVEYPDSNPFQSSVDYKDIQILKA